MKRELRPKWGQIAQAVGLAVLWTGLALAYPASAEEPPYPVWWSPVLELDRIEGIDERLARHIWPGDDEGLPLTRPYGDIRANASAVNCIELEFLVSAGFNGIGTNGFSIQLYTQALCRGIEAMRRAQPAETSYLRDFVLDEEAIHVLPAMVTAIGSCDFLCRQRVANERRIPLSRFEPVIKVTVRSGQEIRIQTIDWESIITILGRGDFNGDGLDDLLVLASSGSISGTWSGADLYLLSRDAPGAVLFVAEELTNGCDDYQCQETYDYPEALKEVEARPPSEITIPVRGAHTPSHLAEGRYPVWWSPSPGAGTIGRFDPQPAARSFLRNLTLDKDALDVLPALLGFWPDRCVTCRAQAFNNERRSWRTLNQELAARDAIPTFRDGRAYQVEVASDWELIVHGLLWRVTLNVSGGGDVDGDGLEDLIIERQIEYDMKGYNSKEHFALTRDSPDGTLRVINADDILDPDQPCGGAYAQGGHYWKTSPHCAMSDDEKAGTSPSDQNQSSVWWSDDLRLDKLSLIDKRLKQPFEDFGGDALAMDTWPESENGHVHAKTCQELFDYLGQDYGFVSDHDLGAWQVKRCEAIRKLKQAEPATISHLTDFTINRTTIGHLPTLIDHVILGTTACWRYLYNQARFTWQDFGTLSGLKGYDALGASEDTVQILRVSDQEALAVNDHQIAHLRVIARGDFNGDGLDDILLETTFWEEPAEPFDPLSFDLRQFLKTGQSWVTSGLYVLSRDCPEGPLWLVDAKEFLGPAGTCDDWFAETEWIATHW